MRNKLPEYDTDEESPLSLQNRASVCGISFSNFFRPLTAEMRFLGIKYGL